MRHPTLQLTVPHSHTHTYKKQKTDTVTSNLKEGGLGSQTSDTALFTLLEFGFALFWL